MNYGVMPLADYAVLDKTLDLVLNDFPNIVINTLELGVREGNTSKGIRNFINSKGRLNFHTGIDNLHDMKVMNQLDSMSSFLVGNTDDVHQYIVNGSQHFVLIDANHSLDNTTRDFYNYESKVKVGGYLAFHDTGKQIQPFTDFQGGDKDNPDHYISCRKAITEIGLFDKLNFWWELVFDEADETKHTGGLTIFKKIRN